MTRLIKHTETGPIEIPPQEKSVWICACGLTQNTPFCDGSHKICKKGDGEEAGKLYIYNDEATEVVKVIEDE